MHSRASWHTVPDVATIGIDVTALAVRASGGIGASQYATMRALAALDADHRYIMYAATPPVIPFTAEPLDLPWELRLGTGVTTRSNILWMQTGINRMLREDQVDLVWSPRHLLPLRARGVALVATIQDFWHLHYPEQQPLANRTLNRLLIEQILRRADHLVTTSAATARDATEHYGVSAERLSVVPLGVDRAQFHPVGAESAAPVLERLGITGPFLLAMDVFNPRKNFGALLQAFALLPVERRDGLQVVGLGRPRRTAGNAAPTAQAARLGLAERLVLPGDVSFNDLLALYSSATAFVYPSVYEGFGMPVLEAMACGCPVITATTSSLPGVAGDAALLVDPASPTAIAAATCRLLAEGDLRARLADAGARRAAELTWDATARGMLAVFDRVLADRRSAAGGVR